MTDTVPPARTQPARRPASRPWPPRRSPRRPPAHRSPRAAPRPSDPRPASAPDSTARSRRPATGSTASTRAAPSASAERTAHSPTAPRPEDGHRAPGGISARWAPAQPVERLSVSSRAASSSIPSGIGSIWKSAAGTATAVACPAGSIPEPKTWGPPTHRTGSPVAQPAQRPQPATEAVSTRSPGRNRRTSGPTSSTVPRNSWPTGIAIAEIEVAVVEVQVRPADGRGVDRHDRAVGSGRHRSGASATPTRPGPSIITCRTVPLRRRGRSTDRGRLATVAHRATGRRHRPGRRRRGHDMRNPHAGEPFDTPDEEIAEALARRVGPDPAALPRPHVGDPRSSGAGSGRPASSSTRSRAT